MDLSNLESDIPLEVARAAHQGTSFVPEQRAEQERRDYAETLKSDYGDLMGHVMACEPQAPGDLQRRVRVFEDEFQRYRQGYRHRYVTMLQGMSRCISPMITGPSKFPVRRQEKANNADAKKREDLIGYRKWALEHIRKCVRPDLAPIMSSDGDACERLEEKIDKAEKQQELMRAANKIIHGKPKNERTTEKINALTRLGLSAGVAEELFKQDDFRRVGFAGYQLSNNNANLHRMKDRLLEVGKSQSQEASITDMAGGIRIEESPADNRLRIYFPGKPSEAERTELKHHGFRWTPSLGCWQAYLNWRSKDFVNRHYNKQQ